MRKPITEHKLIKLELGRRGPDVPIFCPVCGKRLFDWQGPAPAEDFSIELPCSSCGAIFVTSRYIKKRLTNDFQYVKYWKI